MVGNRSIVVMSLSTLLCASSSLSAGQPVVTFVADPGFDTLAADIDNNGRVIGSTFAFTASAPGFASGLFVREADGSITLFDDPNPASDQYSRLEGMNDLGVSVGSFFSSTPSSTPQPAFLRQIDGSINEVNSFDGTRNTFLLGINNSGWSVGRSVATGGIEDIFLRAPDGTETVIAENVNSSGSRQIGGINDSNTIVGSGFDPDAFEPFLFTYRDGAIVDRILAPAFTYTFLTPTDINNNGIVVGYGSLFFGGDEAFVWVDDQFIVPDFDLPDTASDIRLTGINDLNQVTGSYFDATTFTRVGFISDVIPSPSAVSVLGIAAACAIRRRR